MKVVVIGAGISGLAAAHRLVAEAGRLGRRLEVTVIEASERAGGVIQTRHFDDFLVEDGPDSFITTKPAAIKLCEELGLAGRLVKTDERFRRAFVARDGRLVAIPAGFTLIAPTRLWSFLDSELFTWHGKWRAVMEYFEPPGPANGDESLQSFIVRRFGSELYERLAQPLVGGIYTGDPGKLSARAVIPQFVELEHKHGSVIKGILKQKGADLFSIVSGAGQESTASDAGARYSVFVTLKDGMDELVKALVSSIGPDRFLYSHKVTRLVPKDGDGWLLKFDDRDDLACDAVVAAVSAKSLASMMGGSANSASGDDAFDRAATSRDSQLISLLMQFQTASSVVLNALFKRDDIGHPLDGFGAVVPDSEGRSALALSFSSIKFPGRAPAGHVMIRAFLGGALKPELNALTDTELINLALADMKLYLQCNAYPEKIWLQRWPDSMPQYALQHPELAKQLSQLLSGYCGLYFAGNALDGVGIPDCIDSGSRAALKVLACG